MLTKLVTRQAPWGGAWGLELESPSLQCLPLHRLHSLWPAVSLTSQTQPRGLFPKGFSTSVRKQERFGLVKMEAPEIVTLSEGLEGSRWRWRHRAQRPNSAGWQQRSGKCFIGPTGGTSENAVSQALTVSPAPVAGSS